MHETYPEAFYGWYSATQPSATSLSVKNINEILIFTNLSPTSAPEFPTMALPAALIVGLLGAVLFIKRSKEN
jgi:hypothetical protein